MVGNIVVRKETTAPLVPFSAAACKAISHSLSDYLRYTFLNLPMDVSTALSARDFTKHQTKISTFNDPGGRPGGLLRGANDGWLCVAMPTAVMINP